MAEYSPPIPAPVSARKSAYDAKFQEKAVSAVGAEIEQQRDGKKALASKTVSEVAEEKRTGDCADEIKSCAGSNLRVRESERI